jgi:hypothetical protein
VLWCGVLCCGGAAVLWVLWWGSRALLQRTSSGAAIDAQACELFAAALMSECVLWD